MNTQTKNAISKAYFTKGAYLVDAHGFLASPDKIRKIVPDNTVIYFMAQPGFCINIPTTLGIQNEFFTSKNKLFNFLYRAGNAVKKPGNVNLTNVSNIDTRIKIPGDKYLNMNVNIEPNKTWPTMGYIKKLPTKTSNKIPTFDNIVPLRSGRYRLSELLKDRFQNGGVFIISSCRAIPNTNNTRMRHPNWEIQQPSRGTAWTNAITSWENFKKPIKGRHMRKIKKTLHPLKPKTVKSSKYPPATLKKLRELVTKKGENVFTALKIISARANLETRKPGELPFLMNQQRLAALPNTKFMKMRSGLRLRKTSL
jgi:hypothetical protein